MLKILAFNFGFAVTLAFCQSVWAINKSCLSILHASAEELNPVTGSGVMLIQVSEHFTNEYVDSLFSYLPAANGFQLIADYNDVSKSLKAIFPDLDLSRFDAVYTYAADILDVLNRNLPAPENGSLAIESLRVVISEGDQEQINENWHVDGRYLTVVTNLKGEGTIYDSSGLGPNFAFGWTILPPTQARSLASGEAIIFSGLARHLLFDGPGAAPLAHRAPEGKKGIRMGIVLFIAPQGMQSQMVTLTLSDFETNVFDKNRHQFLSEFFSARAVNKTW